jgi:hypothetical protein
MNYLTSYGVSFLLLINCMLSSASEINKVDFSLPNLPPEKILKLAEKHLKEVPKLDLRKYYLSSVSFNYYNSSQENGEIKKAKSDWNLVYNCIPDKSGIVVLGCNFVVVVSNETEPVVKVIPGI